MKKNLLCTVILFLIVIISGCKKIDFDLPEEIFVEYSEGDFEIMQYEVTVKEYKRFCKENGKVFDLNIDIEEVGPLSWFLIDENSSMIAINAIECAKYANWLSKKAGLKPAYKITKDKYNHEIINYNKDSNGYRMPTPEEWMWAAQGGIKSKGYKYPGSNDPNEIGWTNENSNNKVHAPGLLKPNELNIYDMYGNAGEWCWGEYLLFTSNIKIYEDPSSKWEELMDDFFVHKPNSQVYKSSYVYEKLDNIMNAEIQIEDNYKYDHYQLIKAGADFFASTGYNSFSNLYYPVRYIITEFQGIRLVRNASTPIKKSGKINYTRVRLRSEPNLTCETKMMLNTKEKVSVIAISTDKTKIEKDNFKWYKVVTENGTTGWVYGKYLDIEK